MTMLNVQRLFDNDDGHEEFETHEFETATDLLVVLRTECAFEPSADQLAEIMDLTGTEFVNLGHMEFHTGEARW